MREDHQETLEKMIPNGYIMIYIKPNMEPSLIWFNPNADEVINAVYDLIEDKLDGQDELN